MKRVLTFATILALGPMSAVTAATASSASERAAKPDCPKASLCVWADANYEGQRVVVKSNKGRGKILREMNDQASSAFLNKRGDRVAVLYRDFANEVVVFCLTPENRFRAAQLTGEADDSISSSAVKEKVPSGCPV